MPTTKSFWVHRQCATPLIADPAWENEISYCPLCRTHITSAERELSRVYLETDQTLGYRAGRLVQHRPTIGRA